MFTLTLPWLVVVASLLLWLPQNAVHEGAHCLAHKYAGDEIVKFWPFPSWALGSFSFAYMSYRRRTPVSPHLDGFCAAAPQIVNTCVLALLIPLHFISLPPWLFSICAALVIVNFADGAVNLGTFYRSTPRPTDGWTWAALWKLPTWGCRAFAVTWHLLFGAHVAAFLL
jgi:hypothetical protein